MNEERIVEILKEWNFWNKEIDIGTLRKRYLEKLLRLIETDKVISIVGVRRSGKSTLIKQIAKGLIERGIDKNNTLIINFEEPEFENIDAKFLLKIYQAYLEIIGPFGKPYLFLDEIQNVNRWEKFVRSLNEKKEAFIVVTGSSSKLLSEEFSTVLTGRQLYFEIMPLSFKEFLDFRNLKIKERKDIILNSLTIKKFFREYLQFGGFPEVVLNQNEEFKRRVLLSYYEDIINRDITQRFKVKKIDKLKVLAHFYLTNISSYVSFNKISKFIKLPVETTRRFSSYIEISKLIFFLKRFSFSVKEQENSPRKVYSVDVGLSNTVGFKFSKNYGKLAENVVALNLKEAQTQNPLMEIYYWKNRYGNKETDFLVKEGAKIKELIQVCWDITDEKTKQRELEGLSESMKEFRLEEGLIITGDFEGTEELKGKRIVYQPLWKWLLSPRKQQNRQLFQQLNIAYNDASDSEERKWRRSAKNRHRKLVEE